MHLLLRAMVGYDWVDDLNGQEMRVRGAFTEQDVVVLEVSKPRLRQQTRGRKQTCRGYEPLATPVQAVGRFSCPN